MCKQLLFKSMLLLCALVAGGMSAWAEEKNITITIASFTGLPNTQAYGTFLTVPTALFVAIG